MLETGVGTEPAELTILLELVLPAGFPQRLTTNSTFFFCDAVGEAAYVFQRRR